MTRAPAALILARAPSEGNPALERLLGREGSAALHALLIRRAAAWALTVAPGAAFAAVEPRSAVDEVAALVPAGVVPFAHARRDLAGAVERIGRGPLLIADPACPRLGAQHAAAALDDLAAGCDVTFGSTLEGGWYLAGLREPRPELLRVPPGTAEGPGGIGVVLERAKELTAEVGMLRHERVVATPADVAALLADPLVAGDLRAALSVTG